MLGWARIIWVERLGFARQNCESDDLAYIYIYMPNHLLLGHRCSMLKGAGGRIL